MLSTPSKVHGGIIVRQAHPGEEFRALDGSKCVLSTEDLAIADTDGPIALAGVMGGEKSGVTDATTEILLESAFFEPSSVRRSARFHNLQSESSYRFERGVDPIGVLVASARATRLIEEIAGGRGDEMVIVAGAAPAAPDVVVLRLSRCRSLLGADVSANEVRDALFRLGLAPAAENEDAVEWKIPSYRRDLSREVDLIEEVARVVGIERIPSRIAATPARPGGADEVYDFQAAVRQHLRALGLSETRTSTLVSERMLWQEGTPLRLRNPVGRRPGFPAHKPPSWLDCGSGDATFGMARAPSPSTKSAECFTQDASEEHETLAFSLYGEIAPRSWRGDKAREFDWHDAKGIVQALAPVPLECIRKEEGPQLALSVELLAQGERIGVLGQLAPAFARALDAIKPVLVGEIALEKLRAIRLPVFHDIPKFPAVVRDIAVVCPIALPYGDLERELWNANEKFLVRIEPFDILCGSFRRKTARQSQIDRDLLDIPRAGEDAEQRGSQRCLRPLEAAVEGKAGSGFPGIVLSKNFLVRRKAKTPICPAVLAIERRKLPNR